MIKSKVMIGATAGLISGVIKDIIDLIFFFTKLTKNYFGYIAGGMFSTPQEAHTVMGVIVGYLANFTIDALLGVVFIYFIALTEFKYIKLKGIGFGAVMWLTILGALVSFHITTVQAKRPLDALVMFFTHTFFGFCMAIIIEKMGKEELFDNFRSKEDNTKL